MRLVSNFFLALDVGRAGRQTTHTLLIILVYPTHCSFCTSGNSLNYVFSETRLAGVSRFRFFQL